MWIPGLVETKIQGNKLIISVTKEFWEQLIFQYDHLNNYTYEDGLLNYVSPQQNTHVPNLIASNNAMIRKALVNYIDEDMELEIFEMCFQGNILSDASYMRDYVKGRGNYYSGNNPLFWLFENGGVYKMPVRWLDNIIEKDNVSGILYGYSVELDGGRDDAVIPADLYFANDEATEYTVQGNNIAPISSQKSVYKAIKASGKKGWFSWDITDNTITIKPIDKKGLAEYIVQDSSLGQRTNWNKMADEDVEYSIYYDEVSEDPLLNEDGLAPEKYYIEKIISGVDNDKLKEWIDSSELEDDVFEQDIHDYLIRMTDTDTEYYDIIDPTNNRMYTFQATYNGWLYRALTNGKVVFNFVGVYFENENGDWFVLDEEYSRKAGILESKGYIMEDEFAKAQVETVNEAETVIDGLIGS
jgi:hypothetical protein